MITTLAALVVAWGRSGCRGRSARSLAHPTFEALGRAISVHPDSGCDCGVVIAGAFFCIRSTLFGRHLVVGGNEEAARLAGIRADRVKYIVYMISALLPAAGLVETARLGMGDPARSVSTRNSTRSRPLLLAARPSPVVARRARTVVGALIMQVISTSFNMLLIPFTWSLVLKSVIILAVFCSVLRV